MLNEILDLLIRPKLLWLNYKTTGQFTTH